MCISEIFSIYSRYWPTALYGRPYWLKYYSTRSGPDKCHFNEPTYKTWLEQIESFVSAMNSNAQNKKTPYFSFNFLTEYTHAYFAVPWQLDEALARSLARLESRGFLDDTLLIVLSDHGNRLKFFAYATETGKLEKFLPYLSIRLPKNWPQKYKLNAQNNRNKLISFYDIYQTLRHYLFLNKFGNLTGKDFFFKGKSFQNCLPNVLLYSKIQKKNSLRRI